MMNEIRITVITENTTLRHNLFGQHGQSLLLGYYGKLYLFDTAEVYEGFIYNLAQLKLQVADITGFIYSHRHLDHAGSLPRILDELTTQPVYILPDFGAPDYRAPSPKYQYYQPSENGKFNVALSEEQADKIRTYQHLVTVTGGLQLDEHLYLTGPVEGEMTEQATVLKLPGKGIVVIVGCSHPTLPAMIRKAQAVTDETKVYGIVGGFHLKDSSAEVVNQTIASLKELDPEFIVPSHCTGYQAIRMMQEELGKKILLSGTGQFGTGNTIKLAPELEFELV